MSGLKLDVSVDYVQFCEVAPYVGAWIETANAKQGKQYYFVAPYVGAWIET